MSDYKYITQYEAHGRVLKRVYNNADHSTYIDEKGHLRGGYTTRTKTPDSHHLMTFDVVATRKPDKTEVLAADRETRRLSLLVLDNYGVGDGEAPLSDEFEDVIFGLRSEEKDYTLAINRETGQCYRATYAIHEAEGGSLAGGALVLFIDDHAMSGLGEGLPRVPKVFLSYLDVLKNKQRPFDLSLPKGLFANYIERRIGTDTFAGEVVVSLHISGARIKITNIEIAKDGTEKRMQFMELWGDSYRIHTGWEDSGWERGDT